MVVLFNATTLRKGGAMQAAISCLMEILADNRGHHWHFAISDSIRDELRLLGAENLDSASVFGESPAKSMPHRRQLLNLEKRTGPDCVFTFLGPAYVRFQSPHLLGCAQGWVTHSTWRAYRTLSFPVEWITLTLAEIYQGMWFRRADAWVVQTETAKAGLERRLLLPADRIMVIPNNCAQIYFCSTRKSALPRPSKKLRILCFSAMYKHKRLDIIPRVAKHLTAMLPNREFEFVITLPEDCPLAKKIQQKANALGVADHLVNEGPIPSADGPKLYQQCDICFMPTVLETFSATYPESMAMGLPIVTTDLAFARDVCRDAAVYFRPDDARAAAGALANLICDRDRWEELVQNGFRVVNELPDPSSLCSRYVEILKGMVDPRRPTVKSNDSKQKETQVL